MVVCNAAELPTSKLFSYLFLFQYFVFYDTDFSLLIINDVNQPKKKKESGTELIMASHETTKEHLVAALYSVKSSYQEPSESHPDSVGSFPSSWPDCPLPAP